MASDYEYAVQPHPYLTTPLLYVSHLLPHVTDGEFAVAFETCLPFRPSLDRKSGESVSGTVEFKQLDKGASRSVGLNVRQLRGTDIPRQLRRRLQR